MSLFDTFTEIYDKVFKTESVSIDNLVFKLHYRVTVTALVTFSVVLSIGQVSFSLSFSITYILKNSTVVLPGGCLGP